MEMKSFKPVVVTAVAAFLFSLLQTPAAHAGLYTFTTHTFNTCGTTGRTGPTTSACTTSYSAASWTANSSYFSTSTGIQLWTVPSTAVYRITAYGARGGIGTGTNAGGKGAKAQADISLTQGAQIKILVGQSGTDNSVNSAGGGGGSFVTTSSNSPLVVAGGGGGGGASGSYSLIGVDGSSSNSGTAGRDSLVAGGTSGAGGNTPGDAWSGSSGGGLTGDGGNGTESSSQIANGGGKAFTNGGAGGLSGWTYGTVGGFGGGGGATWGAGAGGGYSGGGADRSTGNQDRDGGGGGGSYVTGSNTSTTAGQNNGAGYVVIQILVGPPDAPTIGTATALSPVSASITFSAPSNNNGDTITAYTAITTPESRTATISQSGSGTITITGLSPNTSYVIRVYATNGYGDSPYSSPSSSITTPMATTSITISLPSNSLTATYNSQTTITATIVGTEGKVTFYLNSKRISKCIGRPTSSLIATCSWKPALHGAANVKAIFTPTSNAYYSSSTTKSFSISRRSGTR